MADDLSKNIVIQITAETGQLQQTITSITKSIADLQDQQKKLTDAGKENSDTFKDNADKLNDLQKGLKDTTAQLSTFQQALDNAAGSLQNNKALIAALTTAKEKYSKTTGDSSKKVAELNAAINTLTTSSQQQQNQLAQGQSALTANTKNVGDAAKQIKNLDGSTAAATASIAEQQDVVAGNKKTFDAHKATMDTLKKSFNDVKEVSGKFGPSLDSAAKGFNLMKTGLAVMKDGIKGVGDALKADGFDFLLQTLQLLFEAFINSSEGSKVLQGALAVLNVIVTGIKNLFGDVMNKMVDAFSHPIDSIKALGKIIMDNIINHFKGFSLLLDGIMHLDWKKIADGTIEATSGIANATDKIVNFGKEAVKTVKQLGHTYKQGYQAHTEASDKSTAVIIKNQHKIRKEIKKTKDAFKNTAQSQASQASLPTFPTPKPDPNEKEQDLKDPQAEQTAELKHQQEILQSRLEIQDAIVERDEKTLEHAKDITSKYEAQKQLINDTATLEITKANGNSEVIKQIEAQRNKELRKLDDAYQDQKEAQAKQKAQQIKDFEMQMAQQVSSAAFSILNNSIKQQSDAKIAALEKDKTAELNNSALTSTQKQAIEAKYQQQEKSVKVKAFKDEQEASIAQAVINGALAITKATSQTGVLSPLVVPEIIAETAIEVAKIASQKPPAYATGGLHYASDGRGGLLPGYSRTDNTNAFLRSGEGIVVSEAMREPWARNLVSAINVGFGGRDFSTTTTGRGFAVGGIFTDGGNANRYYNQPVNDNKNLANTIAYQMINNFPPVYVDVKDINNQQNILAQTINRVNL